MTKFNMIFGNLIKELIKGEQELKEEKKQRQKEASKINKGDND